MEREEEIEIGRPTKDGEKDGSVGKERDGIGEREGERERKHDRSACACQIEEHDQKY